MTKSPRSSSSVFVYSKRSKTGRWQRPEDKPIPQPLTWTCTHTCTCTRTCTWTRLTHNCISSRQHWVAINSMRKPGSHGLSNQTTKSSSCIQCTWNVSGKRPTKNVLILLALFPDFCLPLVLQYRNLLFFSSIKYTSKKYLRKLIFE